MQNDEAELARMGYKQELKRELGLMQVSFSIISVITGIPSLFLYGLNTGGPAVMVWGWVVVGKISSIPSYDRRCVGAAHPTSGGPYFWAAMLSKRENAALASWITGWFNLLGQVAVTTGISFACANFLSTVCTLKTNFEPTPNTTIGLTNTFGVHLLHYLNNISVWWHAVGTVSLVIAILAKAPSHQSASFVFTKFIDNTGVGGEGWGDRASHVYVVVIGVLMAQYTLTGCSKMTEETRNAAMSGSIGIVMAIGVSAPVAQIFLDTVGENGAIVLMVIVIGAMYFCGYNDVCIRRDGGIPGHTFFNKVSAKWRSPIRTVWLACTLSFILGLPSLGSAVAFAAATSIATIGLYISYGIPIALRVIYHKDFVRGPSILINVVSASSINTADHQLQPARKLRDAELCYRAVSIVIFYSVGFWLMSARKWFTGPIKQIAGRMVIHDSLR
ncbi:hypothetical protein BD779DRAFT_1612886 [Infundibulicybe gibba]|nr:hypothetical protein BD779DRAFT_1612886 [Infundibulicybe gibba]